MIRTEAWVLKQGTEGGKDQGRLELEEYSFPDPTPDEVLVEPIFGCWEGNMTHAIRRKPIDVCRLRCENRVVLGNAGVVRAIQVGKRCPSVREGQVYVLAPLGQVDKWGYPLRIFGYDHVGSVGLLAKRTKVRADQLVPMPSNTRFALHQWAASSVRLACAWDNWKVTWKCWKSQADAEDCAQPHVWAWGGGVAVCELQLARQQGCKVAMFASSDNRLQFLTQLGIRAIDRRQLVDLDFDAARYRTDPFYQQRYRRAERIFLNEVQKITQGERVSIFLDNIGTPVFRATLKALARQGVISTLGWEAGTNIQFSRPNECIQRHLHIHTHGARLQDAEHAIRHAEDTGWLPPVCDAIWAWERIVNLAERCVEGKIESYFPVFEINAP